LAAPRQTREPTGGGPERSRPRLVQRQVSTPHENHDGENDKPVEPTHHTPSTQASNPAQVRKEHAQSNGPQTPATPDGGGLGSGNPDRRR